MCRTAFKGYFETTALIQGVKPVALEFRAPGEIPVLPPGEVPKGVPVVEEAVVRRRLRRKSGDPDLKPIKEDGDCDDDDDVGDDAIFDLPDPRLHLRAQALHSSRNNRLQAVRALDESLEACSRDLLSRERYDWESESRVLSLLPPTLIRRSSAFAVEPGTQYRCFGLFAHGGVVGVTTASRAYPYTQRYLLAVLRHHHPQARFTSFVVSVNCGSPVHRDAFNHPASLNYVVGGGAHANGQLWVENGSEFTKSAPPGVVHFREVAPRRWLPGMLWDTVDSSFSFSPHRFHAGAPWTGNKYLLVAFTLSRCVKVPDQVLAELASDGFPLPLCCPAPIAGGGVFAASAHFGACLEVQKEADLLKAPPTVTTSVVS